ncbi:MAG: CHAT domain-containing protein [Rhodocyclaceae bacterium]
MSTLFLSHSSHDDAFVRELRQALADLGQGVWIDSRQLKGGDPLWSEIAKAIDDSAAYAVLVSPAALQSKWVGKELRYALDLQKQRGSDKFPAIPLSLDGTQLGVMESFFDDEPIYIAVSSGAGGVDAALSAILVALGKRLPADVAPTPQPKAEPLEELVLELSDLKFVELDGVRRASARARLVYEPAKPGQPDVHSAQSWRLIAPIGPIEAGELRWYLEQYAIWPSGVAVIQDRARKVEDNLARWGQLLHTAALPPAHTANVLQAWARVDAHAGRRFSVHLDAALEAGAPDAEAKDAQEAATLLLGLPWELLHDGDAFLFQGAAPTRVRRRLPNTRALDVPVLAPPIRILLASARPEDDACGYLDHRASALPLVEAMEDLGGLVRLHVLSPPTLPALRDELERARRNRAPYHVVHFDGHGVYDQRVGLGGLCFEHPEDSAKLEGRRHLTIHTDELGPLLKDHRIPLVFLEACQSAQAGPASESVASELLKTGVASVVAMSHSVLVETARRFVKTFYTALACGARVGDAMLAGQRQLKDDSCRGRIFGAEELHLADWFVPVLFQEKDDPQLFRATPAQQTQADLRSALAARLGELPAAPATGFVGRSRELLTLERLLRPAGKDAARYAVLRGQGGEGKTALAAEFARWMLRSQQIRRAAFVSVETHSHCAAVLDAIGRQLVPGYSVTTFADLEHAILPVERALAEQVTLLVVDNMESILLPPFLADETPEALADNARGEADAILALCARLNAQGETRLVFTSRENLPAPFAGERQRRELQRLERDDAVKLVERVLNAAGGGAATADTAREEIVQLVDAVHCHARSLALLAPALQRDGVAATRAALVELMAEMEKKFPGSREQSLFASVELSLRRMSPANRERARVLGVFHGGVNLAVLRQMMVWEASDVTALAGELIETGLATANRYNHLTLNPALCPYLRGQIDAAESAALTARWAEAIGEYTNSLLHQQQHRNAEIAATLTLLELPNLFALLDHVQRVGDAEAIIALATSLCSLLKDAGKPRLLERVAQVRDAAVAALGEAWNHARFQAERTRIEQLFNRQLLDALAGAQALLDRARAAGEQAYPNADYDLAGACWLLAQALRLARGAEQALLLFQESRQRFEVIAITQSDEDAKGMVSVCLMGRGDCLTQLDRLTEAAAAYEEAIRRDEKRGAERSVAINQGQLGYVRLKQARYAEALAAYTKAREYFMQIKEHNSVAASWHMAGMVNEESGEREAAEDAYRKSLTIEVQLGNISGQAGTLNQLGSLYGGDLNRQNDAADFYRQAADKFFEVGETANEGRARNNLGATLRKLRRLNEARQEIRRAIECGQQFSHAAEPWKTWAVLADIENDAGQPETAARANDEAIISYLAHRCDGGENRHTDGRIALAVAQSLLAGDAATAADLTQQVAADPDLPDQLRAFVHALAAIVAGSRDRQLAESPDLVYTSAAEIILLIETLDQAAPPGNGA